MLQCKHTLSEEPTAAWVGAIIGKLRLVHEVFFAGPGTGVLEICVREEEVVGTEKRSGESGLTNR